MPDSRRPAMSLSPEAPLSNTVRLARQGKPIPALVADPMTFSVPSTSRAYDDDSDSERPVGKRRKRGTTTAQQLAELEREFLVDQHPNSAHRRKLATALGRSHGPSTMMPLSYILLPRLTCSANSSMVSKSVCSLLVASPTLHLTYHSIFTGERRRRLLV
jgi:hypothetical protein